LSWAKSAPPTKKRPAASDRGLMNDRNIIGWFGA
jgi:hypothetical protein